MMLYINDVLIYWCTTALMYYCKNILLYWCSLCNYLLHYRSVQLYYITAVPHTLLPGDFPKAEQGRCLGRFRADAGNFNNFSLIKARKVIQKLPRTHPQAPTGKQLAKKKCRLCNGCLYCGCLCCGCLCCSCLYCVCLSCGYLCCGFICVCCGTDTSP